jgi:hypothetical protein
MYKCNVPACVPSKHGAVDCAKELTQRFKSRKVMDMSGFDKCNEAGAPPVAPKQKKPKKKTWF